jgi:hypothetical protein
METAMQNQLEATDYRTAVRPADALDADVEAFNAAFEELELSWRWDRDVIAGLGATDDRARVDAFLRKHHPHLLKVYDAPFLVDLIVATKAHWGKQAQ